MNICDFRFAIANFEKVAHRALSIANRKLKIENQLLELAVGIEPTTC